MALKARILYDFEGDTENGELVINEGEIVTVLNQDVGDGWWEGQLANGEIGLFPESYVEMVGEDGGGGVQQQTAEHDQFQQNSYQQDSYEQTNDPKWEDDDDEWDQQPQGGFDDYGGGGVGSGDDRAVHSASPGAHSNNLGRAGTVRKNINRFSPFVKTGTEAFVLGSVTIKSGISDTDKIKIVYSPEGTPMWEPSPDPYVVDVKDPEKKSKFKGIKSFTAYNIIPSSTGRAVSRRYKHYDWLHERMVDKFTLNTVPPLPDKQYYGRYGEDFIEKRREKLQRWSNRIARHPVLSRSEVVTHFFLCDDTSNQWKAGKRRAEKDELVAGAFIKTITHPEVTVDITQAEAKIEAFGTFLKAMKLSLSKMRVKFIDHCNQMSGPFMAEFHRMSSVFSGLSQSFHMENEEYTRSLTAALEYTAETYREIGVMHSEQPRNDMIPSLDVIKEYLGLIFAFPDMVHVIKGAAHKVRDCDKMKEEGRIDMTDATEITARSETIAAAVLAEVYHFQHERVVDFREMMKYFLNEQIAFYQEIVRKLEVAVARYDEGTDL